MKTNVLILAAGYGTRLEKDIKASSPKFDHLLGLPKGLLPIQGKPILSHWIETLELAPMNINKVIVISNDKFYEQYNDWLNKNHKNSTLEIIVVNDGSDCNENRLGCCKSIKFGLDQVGKLDGECEDTENSDNIESRCLVIASDILFARPYDITPFLTENRSETSQVYVYNCPTELVHKHGILEVSEEKKVTKFLEKPDPSETESRSACPCFYLFAGDALRALGKFLKQPNVPDSSGHFLRYLVERTEVGIFATEISKRYDIGNLESYNACDSSY